MGPWQSEQPIVPVKLGNASGGKGLAREPWEWGHFLHTQRWIKEVNKTNFYDSLVRG